MEQRENTHFKLLYAAQVNNKEARHAGSNVQIGVGETEDDGGDGKRRTVEG